MTLPIRLKPSHKVLILGDYESGKTTLAKFLLAQMPRSLAWDPRQDVFTSGESSWAKAKQVFQATGRVVYHPGRGDVAQKFEDFLEFAMAQHNCMVFIDEPAMLGSSHALPQAFHDLHRLGHARGIGVMLATHSVWDLPHVTHQANHTFIFKVDRPVELNVLGQMVTADGIAWIQHAPPYHFWHKGPDHQGPVMPIPKGVKDGVEVKGSPPGALPVVRGPAPSQPVGQAAG